MTYDLVSDEVIWLDTGSAKKLSVRDSIIIGVRRPPHIHFATTIHALTRSPHNPSSITESSVRHPLRNPLYVIHHVVIVRHCYCYRRDDSSVSESMSNANAIIR